MVKDAGVGPVPLSRNLGALTSWNPLGPSEPLTGLLFLLGMRKKCDVNTTDATLIASLVRRFQA